MKRAAPRHRRIWPPLSRTAGRWADATSDIEEAVRSALQDAFEGGVASSSRGPTGCCEGDLRDGHRAPLTYLAAFTEVIVAVVEAALEVDALPEPSSQYGDSLEDMLELIRVLCGRYPQVCDRFFSSEDMDDEAPPAALAHLTLEPATPRGTAMLVGRRILRLLASIARGSENVQPPWRTF